MRLARLLGTGVSVDTPQVSQAADESTPRSQRRWGSPTDANNIMSVILVIEGKGALPEVAQAADGVALCFCSLSPRDFGHLSA